MWICYTPDPSSSICSRAAPPGDGGGGGGGVGGRNLALPSPSVHCRVNVRSLGVQASRIRGACGLRLRLCLRLRLWFAVCVEWAHSVELCHIQWGRGWEEKGGEVKQSEVK
jgi:hypothetical protein